jgi:HEAT repeat protein
MRVAAGFFALVAIAGAEELSAALEWEPGHLGTIHFRECPLSPAAPPGVKAPEGLADGRFGVLELADGVRVHVAHEAGGAARGLFVDTDLDGDLAEEAPAGWTCFDGSMRTTDTVRIPLPGESEPFPVLLALQRARPDTHDRLGIVTRVHRRGWIEIGGRLRPVALVDGNGDLRFDDAQHDRAYLDLDGDGELFDGYASFEMLRFGEPFALGRSGYVAEGAQPFGGRVVFRRLSKPPPPRRFVPGSVAPPGRRLLPPPAEPFTPLPFAAASPEARIPMLPIVASYGTAEAAALLLDTASTGEITALRAEAVRQLGHAEYAAHADAVARLARTDLESAVRRAAIAALHFMDAPGRAKVYEAIVRDATDAKEGEVVELAARYLAALGTKASRATLAAAFRDQPVPVLRLEIFQGARYDPEDVSPGLLADALKDDHDGIHGAALDQLRCQRDPKARGAAIAVLETKGGMTRYLVSSAIRVLAYEPDKTTVRALLSWAERGSNDVWLLLFSALRLARDPEVAGELVDGLRQPGARTRSLCADLLGEIRDPGTAGDLAKAAAKERDPDVAARLVRALAALGAADALAKLAGRREFPARGELFQALAGAGKGNPKVLDMFRDALASSKWEERVLALDVAGASGDTSLVPAILANLGHDAWQVRLAAVEALRGVRVREAVLPLIERLEREESTRVRAAIGETLFHVTGQDLMDVADAWRAWWREHGDTFAVPAAPPARKPDEGGTVARFYGLPVRTERVCFVLDRSDSMEAIQRARGEKRTRLEVAVRELEEALKRLPDRARANVVLFGSDVDAWKKGLVPLTDANRSALAAFLAKQVPAGSTDLFGGLEAALLADGVDSIFLLSDGDPTAGTYRDTPGVLAAVRRLNQTRRVAIHTVAIGRDSDLLRRLAEENGGRYARR